MHPGVAGFIRGHWIHRGVLLGSSGGRRVRQGASWGSSDTSRVNGFIGVLPGGSRVQPGSLGIRVRPVCHRVLPVSLRSFGCAQVVDGLIRSRWAHYCSPRGSRVPPGRLVHKGSPRGSSGSSWVPGFIGMRPGGHPVRPGSTVSLGCALAVVVFILGCWINRGVLRASTSSSGFPKFIWLRLRDRLVHLG